jgi:hypothetical protein
MKSEGKIKHKLKQVKHRITQKEMRKATSKKPCNCKHSGVVRGSASEPLFHVCLMDSDKPDEWEGMICDASVPNTCPFFQPRKSKGEVQAEVDELLNSGDMGIIASKYPDIAALLWVLAGVDINSEERNEDDEPSDPRDHTDEER